MSTGSSSGRYTWQVRLGPILVIQGYLLLSVLLFRFSPWEYPVDEPWALYGFLALAQLSLLIGYVTGAFKKTRGYAGRLRFRVLFIATLAANLVMLYPTAAFRTGGSLDILQALLDPGNAYHRAATARVEGDPVIEYVRAIMGPLLALLYPLTIVYWGRLSKVSRALAVAAIGGVVAMFVAMGTNKAIADTLVLFPWMLAAAHFSGVSPVRKRLALGLATGCLIGFLGFLVFFGKTQSMREGSAAFYGSFSAAGATANYHSFMLEGLPAEAQVAMLGLNSYITQGYYALSLALREPFVPMWGVGSSMFLTRQYVRLADDQEFARRSYPVRIEKYGWDAMILWSSLYPWLASDFSFPGTVLVMFFIGRLFAATWLDSLRAENPFAVSLYAMLVTMLLYAPANNQVLQSGEPCLAFFGTLALWLITRSARKPWRPAAGVANVPLATGDQL